MLTFLPALLFGVVFGFLLQKAGLSRYEKIAGVFLFKDLAVLKFMMSAMISGMVGMYLLKDLGWVGFANINTTYVVGNLLGGGLFGIGMGAAGI